MTRLSDQDLTSIKLKWRHIFEDRGNTSTAERQARALESIATTLALTALAGEDDRG